MLQHDQNGPDASERLDIFEMSVMKIHVKSFSCHLCFVCLFMQA
jgi:hypothetical protein